jgi:pyruvate/2-oxoacid:ferredoxin oxidoreductase alpha subunit
MPVTLPAAETVDAFLPPFDEPFTVVDVADPRNVGPVVTADPRKDAEGITRPGYMEIRAQLDRALHDALAVIPEVDAEWAAATGRAHGGLTWEYALDDAEIVLVAAGSIGMQLTVTVDELRAKGMRIGVLGVRAYRPFPAEALASKLTGRKLALVFDKALSYGFGGPIFNDIRAALFGLEGAPVVFSAICGLGGRDVTPADLAAAVQRAVDDHQDGARNRAADWINLAL